jgi:hypothetical protein
MESAPEQTTKDVISEHELLILFLEKRVRQLRETLLLNKEIKLSDGHIWKIMDTIDGTSVLRRITTSRNGKKQYRYKHVRL